MICSFSGLVRPNFRVQRLFEFSRCAIPSTAVGTEAIGRELHVLQTRAGRSPTLLRAAAWGGAELLRSFCRVGRNVGCSSGRTQELTITGERVRSGYGKQQQKRSTPRFLRAVHQEGERLPRLGGHAQAQRILRTRHECLGVIRAAQDEGLGRSRDSSRGIWDWERHQ